MTIGDKIKQLRKSAGLTQTELGNRLGVKKNAVSKWECGRVEDIPASKIKAMANLFDVPTSYLIDEDPPSPAPEPSNVAPVSLSRNVRRINVLGSVPAGVPTEAVEDIIDWEELPEEMFSGGREYFGLRVAGDSMFPDILDGDVVIIRKTPTCNSGNVAVVYVNGYDATLKQVKFSEDGSITLQPRNPNYPPRTFTPEEVAELPVTIAGVVVELRRKWNY